MNLPNMFALGLGLLGVAVFSGCTSTSAQQVMAAGTGAVELRSFQSRAFDTTDKNKTLRTVIATLQDLGFVVDKADEMLGTVSATKRSHAGAATPVGYELRMTVTVRPRGEKQLLVRANAEFDDKAVEEPKPYQDFFTSLEKAMFLTAQEVD